MTNSSGIDDPPTSLFTGRHCCLSLGSALEALDPAYFGFVMSTGIVSISFFGWVRPDCRAVAGGVQHRLLRVVACAVHRSNRGVSQKHAGRSTEPRPTLGHADLHRCHEYRRGSVSAVLRYCRGGGRDVGVTIVATPLLLYYLFVTEIIGAGKAGVSERIDGAFLLVIVCMQSLAVLGGCSPNHWRGMGTRSCC